MKALSLCLFGIIKFWIKNEEIAIKAKNTTVVEDAAIEEHQIQVPKTERSKVMREEIVQNFFNIIDLPEDKTNHYQMRKYLISIVSSVRKIGIMSELLPQSHYYTLGVINNMIIISDYFKDNIPSVPRNLGEKFYANCRDMKVLLGNFDSILVNQLQNQINDGSLDYRQDQQVVDAIYAHLNSSDQDIWREWFEESQIFIKKYIKLLFYSLNAEEQRTFETVNFLVQKALLAVPIYEIVHIDNNDDDYDDYDDNDDNDDYDYNNDNDDYDDYN